MMDLFVIEISRQQGVTLGRQTADAFGGMGKTHSASFLDFKYEYQQSNNRKIGVVKNAIPFYPHCQVLSLSTTFCFHLLFPAAQPSPVFSLKPHSAPHDAPVSCAPRFYLLMTVEPVC